MYSRKVSALVMALLVVLQPFAALAQDVGRFSEIGVGASVGSGSTSVARFDPAGIPANTAGQNVLFLDSSGWMREGLLAKADLPATVGYLDEAETAALLWTFTSGLTSNGNVTIGGSNDLILGTGGMRVASGAILLRNIADSATIASFGDSAIALNQATTITGNSSVTGTWGVSGLSTLTGGFTAGAASTVNAAFSVTGLTTTALIRTTGLYGVSAPLTIYASNGTTARMQVDDAGKTTLTDTGNDSWLQFQAIGNASGLEQWRSGNIGGSYLVQGGNDAGSSWANLFRATQTGGVPNGIYWGTGVLTMTPDTNMGTNAGEFNKKYANLHAGNLWIDTLVAQDTIATIGGNILVGPTTTLEVDLPAATTTIVTKHNEMVSGDIAYMQEAGRTEFIQVTGAPTGTSVISYVGGGQAAAATVAIPTHQVGDLIVIYAFASTAVTPALGISGGTNCINGNGGGTGYRVGSKVAASTSETSGTWTNATSIHVRVYRSTDAAYPMSVVTNCAVSANAGATTSLPYPALTVNNSSGGAWVGRAGYSTTASNVEQVPAGGFTHRGSQGSGPESSSFDTNAGSASVAADTKTLNTSGAVRAVTIEIPAPTKGPFSYPVTRGYGGVFAAQQWYAGDALFNTGTTGDCHMQIYSIQSIKGTGELGPTIQGNCRTSTTYNAWATQWAIGNLRNLYTYGATDVFGAAFGNSADVWIGIDATNGIRFFEGGTTQRAQWKLNGDILLGGEGSGEENALITSTSFSLRVGTVKRLDLTGSAMRFYDDSGSNYPIDINGASATITVGYAHLGGTQPNVYIDGAAGVVQLRAGSTTRMQLAASNGVFTIYDDDGSTPRLAIGPTIARFGSDTAARIDFTYSSGQIDLFDGAGDRRIRLNATDGVIIGKPGAATPYVQITDTTMSFCGSGAGSCTISLNGSTGTMTLTGGILLSTGGDILSTGNFSLTAANGLTFATSSGAGGTSARSITWAGGSRLYEYSSTFWITQGTNTTVRLGAITGASGGSFLPGTTATSGTYNIGGPSGDGWHNVYAANIRAATAFYIGGTIGYTGTLTSGSCSIVVVGGLVTNYTGAC